jgi:hypothetical protein
MPGFIHHIDARFGWWDDRETALTKARSYVDRALEPDPGNADANRTSSMAFLSFRRDFTIAAREKLRCRCRARGIFRHKFLPPHRWKLPTDHRNVIGKSSIPHT